MTKILDVLPAYLVLLSPDYQVPFANRFFRERFGEAQGRRCHEYLFGQAAPCESCQSFRPLETGKAQRWEWRGPDGRSYDIHDFPFHEEDGTALVLEVGLDITELKHAEAGLRQHRRDLENLVEERTGQLAAANVRLQAEIAQHRQAAEALKASEARFRTLAAASFEGILISEAGRVVDANERLLKMMGYSREALIGKPLGALILPEDRPKVFANVQACRESDLETQVVRHDGSRLFVEIHGKTLQEQGRAIRLTTIRDISERKRAEDAAREAHRRKDEFLATLAHELRNPLAPIRNGLAVLRRAGIDSQAGLAVRVMMERQTEHLVRLVDDLLDVSRISRGQVELRKRPCDLAGIAHQAVETSLPLINGRQHRLRIDQAPGKVLVDADAVRLSQAIANLLNNAAKYTPDGGDIQLWIGAEAGEAVVRVEDNGIGIPAPLLARVFDLFVQGQGPATQARDGLGIGLNLAKVLVEMHGGRIEAHSQGHGLGSEFCLRLPLLTGLPVLPPPRGEDASAGGGCALRVLVVDDNADAALSLATLLDILGHDARPAHDGESAIALAQAFRPDVVFLDIGMPRLNGYEACRRIRSEPWGRDILIAALTGWGQGQDKRQAQAAGFDQHFTKPVDIEALEAFLASMASRRLARRPGRVPLKDRAV